MDGSIELGKLADDFVTEVIDAAVLKAELLDALRRDETAENKFLHHALRYPLGILHVTLVPWQLLDEIGIDELQIEVVRKGAPDGYPIDARTLHPDFLDVLFFLQITHFFE